MTRRTPTNALVSFFLILSLLPAVAQPAQHPARRYLVRGTIQAISPTSVTVTGHDRHQGNDTARTMKIGPSSQVEQGLKVGDQAVADYNYTMENKVYVLVTLRRAAAKRSGR